MPARKPKTDAELALEHIRIKDEAKALYDKADVLLAQLARQSHGKPFEMPGGYEARVQNNWRGKTRAFAPAFSRKFELEMKKVAPATP